MNKYTASKGEGRDYMRLTLFADSRTDAVARAAAVLGSRKGLSVVCAVTASGKKGKFYV